jgi:hypothetical protein
MAQTAKMAFLGFGTLSPSTQKFIEEVANSFAEFEVVGCFDDLRQAAGAVTQVVDRSVTATPGTVLYVHQSQDEAMVAAAKNLIAVGVSVQTSWIDWDEYFIGNRDATVLWLAHNSFPEVDPLEKLLYGVPEADPLAQLLAATPAPVAAPRIEPTPMPTPEAVQVQADPPAEPAPAAAFVLPAPVEDFQQETAAPPTPEPIAFVAPIPEPAKGFQMPPAAATPRNPLIPGGALPASAKQGEGAAFLAPGPDLAQASGPTQATNFTLMSAAPKQQREAVAEFQLPQPIELPAAVTLPMSAAASWEEVLDPGNAAMLEPTPFPERLKFSPKGIAFLWTGSSGGSGKTTTSWTSANTLAATFKRSGRETPVYLVETDFGNPKLENRLRIPANNTALAYLKYLKWLEENGSVQDTEYIGRVEAKAIEEATWTDPATGLKVIAAPYDTRTSTSENVQDAILQLSRKLLSEDAVVFFDSGTVGRVDDKMLDRELAHLSTHVIIATSAGQRDAEGKWVNASIDDMRRMAMTFSTSTEKGGWGLDRAKIQAFFNKTDYDSYEERRYDADPIKVCGYLPYAPSLETSWIGDMQTDPAVDVAVTQIARAIYEIEKFPELAAFAAAPEPESVPAAAAKRPRRFGRRKE